MQCNLVCVCAYVVISLILDVRFVDAPAGVTQEEGHTGFLHLPSAVLALIFYVVAEVKPRIARALSHQEAKSWTAVRRCTLLSQVGK